MTPQPNQVNGAVTFNLNRLRFGRTAVKQRARSHGRVFREEAWLAAILAYSSEWQGIFFRNTKITLYCDGRAIDRNISWLQGVNQDSFHWESARCRVNQNNLI